MEKLRWLADFRGKLDEVALSKTVTKLNLHRLDLLAVASKIVQLRDPKNHRVPNRIHKIDDGYADYEAEILKHRKRKALSSSPSNKPYNHDVDDQSLSCIPSNKPKTYIDDHHSKAERLRREKLKKPMIEEPSPVSLSSKRKCASNPNQGISFREPVLCPTPLSYVLPLSKNTNKSNKNNNQKKKKKKKLTYTGPATPPDLPIEFRNMISEMGGSEIQLLIQKPLYKTDITEGQSRLSMPFSQIKARNFVREEEWVTTPSKKGNWFVSVVENVPMIDTKLRAGIISLRKWPLFKANNKSSVMYNLSTTWNDLVKSNQLKCGNIVQVWSFRVGLELNLAIVLVEDCVFESVDEESGTASSTSNEETQE